MITSETPENQPYVMDFDVAVQRALEHGARALDLEWLTHEDGSVTVLVALINAFDPTTRLSAQPDPYWYTVNGMIGQLECNPPPISSKITYLAICGDEDIHPFCKAQYPTRRKVPTNLPTPYQNIDWGLLKKQKIQVLNYHMDGVAHILDVFQDYAVDELGVPHYYVFPQTPIEFDETDAAR